MNEIFVISDTHLNHTNIIRYCGRPFKDADHMNEVMVNNWNSVVTPQDIVYHLGDVYIGNAEKADSLLSRLNGKKRLILGNHDEGKDRVLYKHFQKILAWRMFPEYEVVLTHMPLYLGPDEVRKYKKNIHGHIHEKLIMDPRYINVSVEVIRYTPVKLKSLV